MDWSFYAIISILFLGVSDLFRKLGSSIKDPIFANLIFQAGSFLTAMLLFLSSRKVATSGNGIVVAFIGGILISLATLLSFKALSLGPGVSVVMPTLRIGGVVLVSLLGVLVLREKLAIQTLFGLLFSAVGIYLLFSNK